MSLFQEKVMDAIFKIKMAHESEKQELLSDLFQIGKRSEKLHRENARLRKALQDIANEAAHPTMKEAINGELGEYKRGWYSCMQSLSDRAKKALDP